MLRRPVSPRGLWESSVVLSESESSAVVTGGSGFGRCFVVIGAWQLDTDPLCTRGLNIINSRKPSLRDGHTRLLQHKDLRRHRKHLPDLLTVSNSGLIFSWPCQCLALCVCVCVCVLCAFVCRVNWGNWYDYTLPTVETQSTVDIPSWLSSIS